MDRLGRTSLSFVAFVLATSNLPDVDLTVRALGLPVHHHGVTHTVVFVLGIAVVAGGLLTAVLSQILRRWWHATEGEDVNEETIYAFVTGGLALGGLGHLLADVLARDWAEPVEPFWPFLQTAIEIGVVSYDSFWVNLGMLVVAVGVHVPFVTTDVFPLETWLREWAVELAERPGRRQPLTCREAEAQNSSVSSSSITPGYPRRTSIRPSP